MTRRATRARIGLLVLAVWAIGHELALAVGHGPAARAEATLRATGHGAEWLLTVVAAILAVATATLLTGWRIAALERRLHAARGDRPTSPLLEPVAVLHTWRGVLGLALVAFVVQENVEHFVAHAHLPGLAALVSGQYVATLPIFAVLSLVAALTAAALRRRIVALVAAIRLAESALRRAPSRIPQPPSRLDDLRATARRLTGAVGGRAPPPAWT